MEKKRSGKATGIIICIIFALAFYLRLDAYLINNSFFTDEILLARNIFEKNFGELFLPLQYFQSAPYLFLAITKVLTLFAGINELVFRLLPLISSLISVYLFYVLLKIVINSKPLQCLGLLLFAVSYPLLFYSQVFKQYSTDVCITILILIISQKVLKHNDISALKWMSLGIVWSFCILLSFPALFVIPAFYAAYIYREREKESLD